MNQSQIPKIWLLQGPESFLASRALASFRAEIIAQFGSCRVVEAQGTELASGELVELCSPTIFAEPSLLYLTGATDSLIAELLDFLEDSDAAADVFVAIRLSNSTASEAKLVKAIGSFAKLVRCDEIKREQDRADFIRLEFKSFGRSISADAAKALQLAFSADLTELAAACAQLAVSAEREVTLDLVESLFGGRVETSAFKIADAALSRDAATAITLLRHGLNTGIDPIPLLAALSMRLRQLARIVSDRSISAAALGMAPWQFERVRKDLRGRNETELIQLVRLAALTDAHLKGASRDPAYSLEKFVLALATS